MLLEVKDLKVDFGGTRVLRGVSLTLAKGGVACLIGGNGAGKTTTLRSISGLKSPSSGEIVFKGRSLTKMSPPAILNLGIAQVPQEGRAFRDMTVLENMLMGAFSRPKDPRVKTDLELVYGYFPVLGERAGQRAGSLFGGERQMLAIGRALMSRPRMLMLDEPSAGLAPMIVNMVGQIVRQLNRDGLSIILVEQNAELALRIASYGYVMERGRIVINGPSAELMTNDAVRKAYLGI